MRYFITPKYDVAFNPKVGSSTLARAIVRDFYPEVEAKIQNAAYPAGKDPENSQWQGRECCGAVVPDHHDGDPRPDRRLPET